MLWFLKMASNKSNGLEHTDWARAPTSSGNAWQRFLKVIYNPEDKSFFGRTAKRWGIVFAFYLIFYAVLALLFALCLGGLFMSLDENKPTYTLGKSLIGANPGVAYRPLPSSGFVLKYSRTNSSEYQPYLEQLEEFLKPYESEGYSNCSSEDNYGFPDAPCLYIKLNKIYGWEPEYYSDKSSLPADMPPELVDHISSAEHLDKIWISCAEEKDNGTTLSYPWGMGLSSTRYPYLNQQGYHSPLVAVRVTAPVNQLSTIRCRAWAKNIIYHKSLKEPSGYTRIQLHIDDKTGANEAGDFM